MGEVFRARDGKLGRDVAIKVLPDEFARDTERLARFKREAKVLASLNHPGIAAIYGLEESEETHYLVLEFVPGETLAERIARGPIPVEEALDIAMKIAEALEEAHEQGIVHRDLKPANIKLTPDGKVKVLDFGLAKAFVEETPDADNSMSPTLTRDATRVGVILGTAAYMSPEQAKGKKVDKRTDVWAFGAVLYEMLTGKRAFIGEDVSDTLAAVLRAEPELDALPADVSAAMRTALARCLEKDLKRRVRDIGDVKLAMEGAFETRALPLTEAPTKPRVGWPTVGAALLSAALAGIAVWSVRPEAPRPLARFVVSSPAEAPINAPRDIAVAIAADGTRIVYPTMVDGPQFVVRALDKLETTRLGGIGRAPREPFFSPDGNWIGYFTGGILKKVSVLGGPPVTVCELPAGQGTGSRGASWGLDDTIVFATGGPTGLLRVRATGGEPEELTALAPGENHLWPEILDGREAVLFTIVSGSVDSAQIAVLSLATGDVKILLPGGSNPRYMPTGHIVYGVGGTLRAVGFDIERLEVTSEPVPVLEDVLTKSTGAASFGVSQTGSLVYLAGAAGNIERTLVWVDREGRETALPAEPRAYRYPRISPDGTRLALDVSDQQQDIWTWDFAHETLTRLTFNPAFDGWPAWTPDGHRIAFGSARDGRPELYWKASDGTGAVERLNPTEDSHSQLPQTFSPDGAILLFRERRIAAASDLGVLSMDTETPSELLLTTEFDEGNPEFSPDGRWLAYQSDESGDYEVYVRPFPNVDDGQWQVSTGGGTAPLWARNGRELFFLSLSGQLTAVPVQTGPSLSFGNPEVVIEQTYSIDHIGRHYDISPDGKRFLMIKQSDPDDETARAQLILVQNWLEELKRLVPVSH